LVSCAPKTANTRKDIYLFIYLLIGKRESGPLLLLWILFFFALYVPTQPPTTQKATAPFALTHEDMTCYHFRPKKKKTI
jgi:hypothetical protein